MDTRRIVFSGSGGQGIITAAIILAESAAIHEGLNAVQTQAYGPEARGGASRADVVISTGPIHYPKVIHPHILICLTQSAYDRFSPIIRPGGLLITDNRYVKPQRKVAARQEGLDMFQAVMDRIGKPVVFNICVLGALIGMTGLVRPGSVLTVLEKRVPPEFLDINREALETGLALSGERPGRP
ncbi:MAG: 2-oxoacid:ferredoxin oxidoreductase subunit gamma [Deltaproteobacteria bacterium]|nr:MAG: 2-oxoacid:ferredoxin oxidoreductase subunit gamma [Deltaproteobacteria bacterium]